MATESDNGMVRSSTHDLVHDSLYDYRLAVTRLPTTVKRTTCYAHVRSIEERLQ